MKKWIIKEKKFLENLKIFDLFKYKLQSPYKKQKKFFDFYVFNSPDWINILPITKNNEVVFTDKKDEIEHTDELNNARKKRRRSSASIE